MSPSMEKTPSVMRSLRPGRAVEGGQLLFGGGDVLVREDVDLGAREAAAVDDAGVVELVGDDVVVLAEDGGDGAGVGGEAGLKDDAGFDVLEGGDAALRAPCACASCR